MQITKIFRAFFIFAAAVFLTRGETFAQASAQCQPPEISAAVYDFVPEARLQTGDFRPLMKTETSFIDALRETPNSDLSDYTTRILPAEIQPEPEKTTENLQPSVDFGGIAENLQ